MHTLVSELLFGQRVKWRGSAFSLLGSIHFQGFWCCFTRNAQDRRWLPRPSSVFPSGASWICLNKMRRQRRGPPRFTPPAPPPRHTPPGWTATGVHAYVSTYPRICLMLFSRNDVIHLQYSCLQIFYLIFFRSDFGFIFK